VATILFAVIAPLVLLGSMLHAWLSSRRRVKLTGDDHPGLHGSNVERVDGPREIEEDTVWA
jgi:hypothetical protein